MKKFSELVGSNVQFNGEKTRLEAVIDKEIIIKNFILLPSKFLDETKEFAVIEAELDSKPIVLDTGSSTIMQQLKEHKDDMPFAATIKKVESEKGRTYFKLS
jgi:hypothetical protein